MNEVVEFLREAYESGIMKQSVNLAKGYSLTKNGRYDDDMLIGKGTGNIKSTLFLPGIFKMIRRNNNLERINSDSYKELKNQIVTDAKCAEILKSIKKELAGNRRSSVLKKLKSNLNTEIKRVKNDYINKDDSTINENFEFICESLTLESVDEVIIDLLENFDYTNPVIDFLNKKQD